MSDFFFRQVGDLFTKVVMKLNVLVLDIPKITTKASRKNTM